MTSRFDVVTLDLDGTLLPHDTVFAAVLRANGHARAVEASDARYAGGSISLEECFWEQWALVQALSLAECHRALRKAEWLPRIGEGVALLRDAGLRVNFLTDQPSTLTDFLGRWGLVDAIASPVTVKEGRPVAIDARFDKLANLQSRLGELDVPLARVCHVGNGVNDVPVFRAVGHSIAVFPGPGVAAAAREAIEAPHDLVVVAERILSIHRGGK